MPTVVDVSNGCISITLASGEAIAPQALPSISAPRSEHALSNAAAEHLGAVLRGAKAEIAARRGALRRARARERAKAERQKSEAAVAAAGGRGAAQQKASSRRRATGALQPPLCTYRKADVSAALRKVASAASALLEDGRGLDATSLAPFRAGSISAAEFGTQLRVQLGVTLTRPQLGGLADRYDPRGSGAVGLPLFLKELYAMGRAGATAAVERRGRAEHRARNVAATRETALLAASRERMAMAGGESAPLRPLRLDANGKEVLPGSAAGSSDDILAVPGEESGRAGVHEDEQEDQLPEVDEAQLQRLLSRVERKLLAAAARLDIERGGLHTRADDGVMAELGAQLSLFSLSFSLFILHSCYSLVQLTQRTCNWLLLLLLLLLLLF